MKKVPALLKDQLEELTSRAANSVVDPATRDLVIEMAHSMLCASLGSDDVAVDGDAIINDNEDDGYWVTCRIFVRYCEVE